MSFDDAFGTASYLSLTFFFRNAATDGTNGTPHDGSNDGQTPHDARTPHEEVNRNVTYHIITYHPHLPVHGTETLTKYAFYFKISKISST